MNDKIYTFFVSSTYRDLIEERRIIREAIVSAGHVPVGMEYFTAGNKEQFDYIKPLIEKSDYYILIVAGKYGSIHNKTKKSYTEMEYDYAIEKGIPVASFLLNEDVIEERPAKYSEKDDEKINLLTKFRKKVSANKMCKFFSNSNELLKWINLTIDNLIKDHEREGWVRPSDLKLRPSDIKLSEWGFNSIYKTRSLMNEDCDFDLRSAEKQVDVISFGLRSFRTEQDRLTNELLQRGVNFRILTMYPSSDFVSQREREEKRTTNYIKNSINDLIEWANNKNKDESNKGKIIIKGYKCMTLDFYWRVDDVIYLGPYLYGLDSQKTISYKFTKGEVFNIYTDYFERLWSDKELTKQLRKPIKSQRTLKKAKSRKDDKKK